jgi:hypothetical protein
MKDKDMATVTTPPHGTPDKRADWQRKVSDPLERLRGYIRLYVSIEGAAILLLYLALWFWIGLLLDYGFFKVLGVDWVQVPHSWGFRAGLLIVLLGGLLALLVIKVSLRLMREFRDSALALVLERRFPKLLGDRLITAVELADPQKAVRYGYSQAMIDQTIQDAAERVDQVPVNEAFNWRRLRNTVVVISSITLGLFLLCWVIYAVAQALPGNSSESDRVRTKSNFFTDFGNVSAIWFERNILLQNTIWPRRCYLELVGFPDNPEKEMRVGKNVGSAPIRVRALKWIYADKSSPEGWRQLMWSDLDKLLGAAPPPLPAEFFKRGQDWSVDSIDALTDDQRDDMRQKMNLAVPGVHAKLRGVIDQLTLLTAESSMSRTLRQLDIPDEVVISYWGDTAQGDQTLKREDNNEYAGTLQDLKETVKFQAHAIDYWTDPRTIAVVPPPTLQELEREEAQPAYLYHRVPLGGSAADLKGRKHRFPRERVYLGGDTSRIDLPAGTDLKLIGSTGTGEKDKDLEKVAILPRGLQEFQKTLPEDQKKLPPAEVWMKMKNVGPITYLDVDVPSLKGKRQRAFEVQISNITTRLDFDFEMTDKDNVVARRHVIIQPADDVAPEVEVGPTTVRKTAEGYMVTAVAKIPFDGQVRDDHGIANIQYHYAYSALEEKSIMPERIKFAIALAGIPFFAPASDAFMARAVDKPNERTGEVPLDSFEGILREKARQDVSRELFLKRLQGKPEGKPLVKHEIRPDFQQRDGRLEWNGFDLQRHLPGLKVTGVSQPRYRLRLRLAATDNNVETGPGVTESKETFTFVIVPEDELLGAIAKEEADLHDKLKGQALGKLEVFRSRLALVSSYLKAPDFKSSDYNPQAELTLQIADGISTAALTSREVREDYVRILRELEVNRVEREKSPNKVKNIIDLLNKALDDEFPLAEEAMRELQQAFAKAEKDPEAAKRVSDLLSKAQARLDDLVAQLNRVIDAMGQLKQLNDRIKELREIVAAQRDNVARLRYLQKLLEDLLFGD